MKYLLIGDLHIMQHTLEQFNEFKIFLKDLLLKRSDIDTIVLLGDILHYHNKVEINYMNLALEFIETLRRVIIIVGNHDKANQSTFLENDSWMNALKKWPDVTIIDYPKVIDGVLFCPYVSTGRFQEMLDTVKESYDTIMCHQEFKGCILHNNNVVSENGDELSNNKLLVFSGHIHEKQVLKKFIYYVGTPYDSRHNENGNHVTIFDHESKKIEDIPTNITRKETIIYTIEKLNAMSSDKIVFPSQKIRVIVTGNSNEVASFKKTELYKAFKKSSGIFNIETIDTSFEFDIEPQENKSFYEIIIDTIYQSTEDKDLREKTISLLKSLSN